MEPLIKQKRVRFPGAGQEKTGESSGDHNRRIPVQKTQSFKEKRKTQNWFQRQLSGKMSQDYDSKNAEHATAVAAAAFAIKSREGAAVSRKQKTANEPKITLVRIKRKKEEAITSKREPGKVSKRFSGSEDPDGKGPVSTGAAGKIPEKAVLRAPSIKKTPTFSDKQLNITSETAAPSAIRSQSFRKAPTFSEEHSNSTGNMTPETPAPKPDLSTTRKPASPSNENNRRTATGTGVRKTQADIWEEAEIARLKERYEKQNATILSWENEKQKKARRQLDITESAIEKKRAKALQKFSREMEYIKQVVEGAREKAEERHRIEVLKVKEKANAKRTGKASTTCFCF